MRTRRQAGEGVAGCVVYLLLAAIAALVLVKMVPVKVKSAEFNDYMVEQAKFAGRRTTAQAVHAALLRKADELGLPVTKKDIKVELKGGHLNMRCTYTVPVDLVLYTYEWKFDHAVRRPVFII